MSVIVLFALSTAYFFIHYELFGFIQSLLCTFIDIYIICMFQLETRFDDLISSETIKNGIASYQLVTKTKGTSSY